MNRKRVIWTERAAQSLDAFCSYIEVESPTGAKKVRKEIIKTTGKLATHAEMFQLDEWMGDPDLNIRRFFKWSYKITYQVLDTDVVILNIFHTSQSFD